MNNLTTSTEIKAVIKNLPKTKSLGPEDLTGEFYKTFREELIPILLKLFQKIPEEGTLPTCSMRPLLPSYQNQTKTPQKKKITGHYLWGT